MSTPLDILGNDLAVLKVPPASPNDLRFPTAEEDALWARMQLENYRSVQKNLWLHPPQIITTASNFNITFQNGVAQLKSFKNLITLNNNINIPPLADTVSTVKRKDIVNLVGFLAEVGEIQDPVLGQFSLQFIDPTTNVLTGFKQENSRRYRCFWILILSQGNLRPDSFLSLLTNQPNGARTLQVSSTDTNGSKLGTNQIYALDVNLKENVSYSILTTSIDILPICEVRRLSNYVDRGYVWGYQGEEPLSPYTVVRLAERSQDKDPNLFIGRKVMELCAGIPGAGFSFNRTVQNLTPGLSGAVPGKPGEAAASPNGSPCVSNDQRITFTNQAIIQKLSVNIVVATNDGNGNALVSIGLNTNCPNGSRFSQDKTQFKIFSQIGIDESGLGKFNNLGGVGSLQWTARGNSSIQPGQTVYVVPAISFPAGSGLSIPFVGVEKVWIDGKEISQPNIRQGYGVGNQGDMSAYAAPSNNEAFIIIVGTERMAIHYIYRKVSIVANNSGIGFVPNDANGCFAFINGVDGRIDSPIKTGLSPGASYDALVYYAPKSNDTLQFQLIYPEYQGIKNLPSIDKAQIISEPLLHVHTQGGGTSVYQNESLIQYAPVSYYLPSNENPSPPPYIFDSPVGLRDDLYPRYLTFRQVSITPSSGLALPRPGRKITFTPLLSATPQTRSLNGTLSIDGQPIGFLLPVLASKLPYQCIFSFAIESANGINLVVLTYNSNGRTETPVVATTSSNTAIDIFSL